MSTTIAKLRAKQQANGNAATVERSKMSATQPTITKPAEAKPAATPKAEPDNTALRHQCGHAVSVKQLLSRQCDQCSAATRKRRAEKRRAWQAQRPQQLDAGSGRLPDGAVYHKTYDAATQTWTATLAIPGLPVFEATASGSFAVERLLDQQYRRHVAGQQSAPSTGATA